MKKVSFSELSFLVKVAVFLTFANTWVLLRRLWLIVTACGASCRSIGSACFASGISLRCCS
jgi:hypothetical protein